jgi:hypothetical protein
MHRMLFSISPCLWLSLMSLDRDVEWTPREALKTESHSCPGTPLDSERAQEETKVLVLTKCHFPT